MSREVQEEDEGGTFLSVDDGASSRLSFIGKDSRGSTPYPMSPTPTSSSSLGRRASTPKRRMGSTSRDPEVEELQRVNADQKREIIALQRQLADKEKSSVEIAFHLQSEIERREKRILQFEDERKRREEKLESEKKILQSRFSLQLQELEAELSDKRKEVDKLRNELSVLRIYRVQREEMESKVQSVVKDFDEFRVAAKAELKSVIEQEEEEKASLESTLKSEVANRQQYIREHISELVAEHTRELVNENQRLEGELRFVQQRLDAIERQKREWVERNKQLARELELSEETVQGISQQSCKHTKEVRSLTRKVRTLEEALTEVSRRGEEQVTRDTRSLRKKLRTSESQVELLQRQLEAKTRELSHLRAVGRQVLTQRSDVEVFLLGALEEVREEMARERSRDKKEQLDYLSPNRRGVGIGGRFPPIERSPPSVSKRRLADPLSASKGEEKVDISELTWRDKERVLRVLFKKINESQESPPSSPLAGVTNDAGDTTFDTAMTTSDVATPLSSGAGETPASLTTENLDDRIPLFSSSSLKATPKSSQESQSLQIVKRRGRRDYRGIGSGRGGPSEGDSDGGKMSLFVSSERKK